MYLLFSETEQMLQVACLIEVATKTGFTINESCPHQQHLFYYSSEAQLKLSSAKIQTGFDTVESALIEVQILK